MNISELSEIITKESGIPICPICGTPFAKYRANQKTCGDDECRRKYHNIYLREHRRRLREENPEEWYRQRREAEKRYRAKKRASEKHDKEIEEKLRDINEYIRKDKAISGLDYGKRQAEKILASIPKIDVNLEGRKDDTVHDKNDSK